jgi:Domain of unknown function (DUF4832)
MPAVFEFYGTYEMMKGLGWWDGKKDKEGRGFRLADCVETGKPTYCDLSRGGTSGLTLLKEDSALVAKLTNRLGYHLVISEVKYPGSIQAGKPAKIWIDWLNSGVAHIFIPARVSFALISKEGKVVGICDAVASNPVQWQPGQLTKIQDQLTFKKIGTGDYILAVGIRQPNDSLKPSIKLGNEIKSFDGWYEIGPITVTSNK